MLPFPVHLMGKGSYPPSARGAVLAAQKPDRWLALAMHGDIPRTHAPSTFCLVPAVGEGIVDKEPVPSPSDESHRVQQLKMLGDVRLPQFGLANEFGYSEFPPTKTTQNPQTRRLCQRLETLGNEDQHFGSQSQFAHRSYHAGDYSYSVI